MSHSQSTPVLFVAFLVLYSGQLSNGQKEAKPDARLGLLASTLGVAPVPGADGQQYADPGPQGTALVGVPYQSEGSQGGNGLPPQNCRCVLKERCGNSGGPYPLVPIPPTDHGEQPHGGLTSGHGEPGHDGGVNPATDGAGVIDVRIVNRPPPGRCPPDQTYCCTGEENHGAPGYDEPNNGGGIPEHHGEHNGGQQGGNGYATCGRRNIINIPGFTPEYGQAQFGAYPWMAVILGSKNNYVGAGALISPYYVLTAAHKVASWTAGTAMKVRLGEWNAQDDSEPYKNVEIEVADVEIHPQFNSHNLFNDIALVRLRDPIDLSAYPHIKSACLPNHADNFVGQRCWVAGFGKDAFGNGKHSYIMKEVDLPVVDTYDCQRRLRSTRLGPQFELNKRSFLCAGGEEGKDACSGDGGSPLVCEYNGKWTVAGLVAWGIGCAEYGVPGVYANVPNYIQWIERKIYS